MNVKVITEGSSEHEGFASDAVTCADVFCIEQANAKVLIDQKSYGRLFSKTVKALVPACMPSVTSQTPETSFFMLSSCYESCINMAASAGAKVILVNPLGVGIKTTRSSETGEVMSDGVWGNMFWTHAKSSLAAKQAVEDVCGVIPDDVTVVFIVPKEFYDDWDCAMDF